MLDPNTPRLLPIDVANIEFQLSQERLSTFLHLPKESFPAQTIEALAQNCLAEMRGCFSAATQTEYSAEIDRTLQLASDELQTVVNQRLIPTARKRSREGTPSVPPEAKRPKAAAGGAVYDGLLKLIGNEATTQLFYDRLSPKALEALEEAGRSWLPLLQIPDNERCADCYKALFLSISPDITMLDDRAVNDFAELNAHLLHLGLSPHDSWYVAARLINLGFLSSIRELHTDAYAAMKEAVTRELIGEIVHRLFTPFLIRDQGQEKALVSCLAAAHGSKKRLEHFLKLPFDLSSQSLEVKKLFLSITDDELSNLTFLFERLLDLPQDFFGAPERLLGILQRSLRDSRLMDFFRFVNQEYGVISDEEEVAVAGWFYKDEIPGPLPQRCPLCTGFSWTGEEVRAIIETYGAWAAPLRFWDAERTGRIEEELSLLTLDAVPRELLLRFLGSKPFPLIKAWLEESIATPTGPKQRVSTLSEAQRNDILYRFRGDEDYAVPTAGWRELLHVSEEKARELCQQEEPPPPRGAERWHRSIASTLDPHDPLSLILLLGGGVDMRALVKGLINARVETICGQRTFLTWGGAEAGASACTGRDAPPLYFRAEGGEAFPVYSEDVFNKLKFGVAPVSLRRRLFALERSNHDEFSRIVVGRLLEEFQTAEGIELFMELSRLQNSFQKELCSSEIDPEGPVQAAFRAYLKQIYREECERSGLVLDQNTAFCRNAFLFLSLLRLAKDASAPLPNGKILHIHFTKGVSFRIRLLSDTAKPRPEDNPGIVDLQRWMSSYPRGSLTPISPQGATPDGFYRFIHEMKDLTFGDHFFIREATLRFAGSDEDPFLSTEEYFSKWKEAIAEEEIPESFFEAAYAMVPIVKNYLSSIAFASHRDEPSGTYLVTDDPNEFCQGAEVPSWLPPSSFSSAVCASFIPHQPKRHDGSCGVNSFLLGYNGPAVYEEPFSNDLSSDIAQFRREVVSYACRNQEQLREEFGKKSIDDIIQKYGIDRIWTGREALAIAARVYGRKIYLHCAEAHENCFRRENHILVPFDEHDCFAPQGEASGPPIHLLHYGQVHFAYLEPKNPDGAAEAAERALRQDVAT